MKIGMDIGTSKSPDAAAFETGPAYNYSFAMDFSKLTTDDVNVGTGGNANFPSITSTSRVISIADADVLAGGDGILLEVPTGETSIGHIGFPKTDGTADATDENLIKASFTSHSNDGIPDGSLSPTYRYLSMVMTWHSVNSEGTAVANYNQNGHLFVGDAAGNLYGDNHFHGDRGHPNDHPRYINGVDISQDMTGRSTSSGMLTSGTDEFDIPMTFTWDMMDAESGSGGSTEFTASIDPAEMRYQHTGGLASVTFHGFIFSKQVPGAVTLPIHTSRPDAAFA